MVNIKCIIGLFFLSVLIWGCHDSENKQIVPKIITVNGPISPDSIGLTLIHEHVFLDWSKADSSKPEKWNNEEAYKIILPYLQEMKAQGVQTFLECTPVYIGRNPKLLKRLSESTGLNILTNTGFYAARNNDHIPAFAFEASVDGLANIWIKEFEEGIEDTGIYPGFIKIGMDSKPQLTEIDQKLIRAAARTHIVTGLTIVSHTGTDTTAAQELAILAEEGVAPDAFVWTHAQRGTPEGHVRLAQKGAWISLDGMGWIRPDTATNDSTGLFQYIAFLENLNSNQLLHKTLISHDAGWYTVGETNQDSYKPYTPIFDLLIPLLKRRGFSTEDFNQLLIENPQKAYTIQVREAKSKS